LARVETSLVNLSGMSYGSTPLMDVFGYEPDWPLLSSARRDEVERLLAQSSG